ncbi:MAG: DeoR/GlpR family DNA-binding transcription regulator, partial [Acidimicrobiales bacterium]
MIGRQRQSEIRRRLASTGFVATRELAAALEVDVSTIRRDLDGLARAGMVQRTHGGALAAGSAVGEAADLPYALKEHRCVAEKAAIAAHAAGLVSDGDSLVLDSGSTTFAVAAALTAREGLTVATNDLRIAHLLAGRGGVRLLVTGGQLLGDVFTLVGPITVDNLVDLHVDWAFLGADAVDAEIGVTNRNTVEVPIKQAMLQAAARAVLVADSAKFGRRALAAVSGLDAFTQV